MSNLFSLKGSFNQCTGAEVQVLQDGSYVLKMVELSLDKKLIHIDGKKIADGILGDIIKAVKVVPLALTVTGKGVLIKKAVRQDDVSEQSIQHLFPQMKLTDFYIQHFQSAEHSYISVARRELIDTIVAGFAKIGVEILSLSLGPFVVDQVIPQLNVYNNDLRFDGHHIVFNDEQGWLNYTYGKDIKAVFPLKIDIEVLPEEFLIGYATAFQLLLNDQLDLISAGVDSVSQQLTEFTAKLQFQKKGGLLLFLFFGLLLVNFLVFSSYNSGNEEMLSRAGRQSDVVENRQKLETEVAQKERLVTQLGWNKGYPYAFLCDQLGQTLPKSIQLEELQVNPMRGTGMAIIKDPGLENGQIRIKGQTDNVYAVNDWIYALKDRKWVKEARLEKFMADDQKQTQVFTLLISY